MVRSEAIMPHIMEEWEMAKYTLQAGRCIVKDGIPLATLGGVGHYDPCELDDLARTIVALLQGKYIATEYDKDGNLTSYHSNLSAGSGGKA
jgi:hypothetical protein